MAQQTTNWTHNLKSTFSVCLCAKSTPSDSDDERERQQGSSGPSSSTAGPGGRHVFARDELEGLLASASSDEDADAMSLHSNVGGNRKRKARKAASKKKRGAWGVVGRNLSGNSRRSIQMFGWYPFGKPIALPDSSEDENDTPAQRRARTLSTATNDSDAAPLDTSDIVSRVAAAQNDNDGDEHESRREDITQLMRANFEPETTTEDLEREERELAEQEEAAAIATFSFPPAPKTPPALPEPTPTAEEAEEEEEQAPSTAADDTTFITDETPATTSSSPALPRTPLSPDAPPSPTKSSAPSLSTSTSTPQTHADRIKKAAKEQRRRLREEAARRKKEEIERRAEAAAGGFGFDDPLAVQQAVEFGEFVGDGVAWTESDGASSHQAPLPALPLPLPLHHIPAHDNPLSPSDDELLDYGAEYTSASRRPRKSTVHSASSSDRLERVSNGSSSRVVRPNMVPLPPSSLGSPRKPHFVHRATGSGASSGLGSGVPYQQIHPGQQQVYYEQPPMQVYHEQVSPAMHVYEQPPPAMQAYYDQPPAQAHMEFDGVPGGLEEHFAPPPPLSAPVEFEGIPGGALKAIHTRSRAGSSAGDLTARNPLHKPKRSQTTNSIDLLASGGFPSTGLLGGRDRAGSRVRGVDVGMAFGRAE